MQNRNALAVLGRSGNPVFRGNTFAPDATFAAAPAAQRMTLGGTVNKTGIRIYSAKPQLEARKTPNIFLKCCLGNMAAFEQPYDTQMSAFSSVACLKSESV